MFLQKNLIVQVKSSYYSFLNVWNITSSFPSSYFFSDGQRKSSNNIFTKKLASTSEI